MELQYYVCAHCGNLMETVHSSGVPMICCGEKMQEIVPGTVDASKEKHVPVVSVDKGHVIVKVGAAAHPMQPEHSIAWISAVTAQGSQRKSLQPGEAPEAVFALAEGDRFVAAYAYCNLHGLWKS